MAYLSAYANNNVLAQQVVLGDCFFKRLTGLMTRNEMDKSEGFLLKPCNQIHTFNMSFAIDVIFLSKNGQVIHIEHNMKANRVSKTIKDAYAVLELAGNAASEANINIGDYITFEDCSN